MGALAARPAATLLDGFTVTAAALVLRKLGWRLEHCLAGHLSAERAHGSLLEALGMKPLLTLGMRLGEGSGGDARRHSCKSCIGDLQFQPPPLNRRGYAVGSKAIRTEEI